MKAKILNIKKVHEGLTHMLIKFRKRYFIVYTNHLMDKTLVFNANSEGKIVSFSEVAGGYKLDYLAAIKELENIKRIKKYG